MQPNFMKFPLIYADLRLKNFSQVSPSGPKDSSFFRLKIAFAELLKMSL